MQMERDMVLDKLGVGVLQDILLVLGKLKRQRMPTVLALREHTGHQFYPPSCSSGKHKTINEGKTHQQKQGNKDSDQFLTIAATSKCIMRVTSPADLQIDVNIRKIASGSGHKV
jgi:hypothetical protein